MIESAGLGGVQAAGMAIQERPGRLSALQPAANAKANASPCMHVSRHVSMYELICTSSTVPICKYIYISKYRYIHIHT